MKWWRVFVGGLLFVSVSVARADMYPDASNAKLPDARVNLQAARQIVRDVRDYNVDVTGATDATAGVNGCLAAAIGGVCQVPPGGRVRLTGGDVLIPAGTTLECVGPPTPNGALFTGSTSASALLLSQGFSIKANGPDATMVNCAVVPFGMTFPQVSSAAWVGTAYRSMNQTGATLRGVTIGGFDVCIDMAAALRVVVQDGYFDCNGGHTAGTASGVFSEPGDAGHITDNKFQVIATSTACPNRLRDGVGVLFTADAGEAVDNLIVQDFRVAQIYFKNSAGFELGKIWVDFNSAAGCSLATSPIGVLFVNSSAIHFDHLDVNSMQTGVVICNSVPAASIQFNDIFGNNVAGDLIQIGTPASSGVPQCGSTGGYEHAGTVVINSLRTQQGTLGPIGGYAVNFLDPTSGNSKLILNSALLSGVHGSTAPYLKFPSTAVAQFDYQVNWSQISSDLGNRSTVGGLTSVACTNVASCTLGGTFVSRNSANPLAGVVQLTGDGTHSSGVITLTIPPITFPNCQATYQYGDSGTWPVTGLVPIVCQSTSATTVAFGWQVGSALGSGLHYNVAFNILPQ